MYLCNIRWQLPRCSMCLNTVVTFNMRKNKPEYNQKAPCSIQWTNNTTLLLCLHVRVRVRSNSEQQSLVKGNRYLFCHSKNTHVNGDSYNTHRYEHWSFSHFSCMITQNVIKFSHSRSFEARYHILFWSFFLITFLFGLIYWLLQASYWLERFF